MNNRPFYSIICPVYNAKKTIGRLIDSVLQQGLEKEMYELILCDDNSNDGWRSVAENYCDKVNIVFCNTENRLVHCPGNTRHDALKYARGEWITFIDCDDMFEPMSLWDCKEFIHETNEQLCVAMLLREWFEEVNEFRNIAENSTWLHGKVYNKDNLIDRYGIDFKLDLMTHEDLYFNSCVLSALIENGYEDFRWRYLMAYRWVARQDSITRAYASTHIKNYLECNLQDYITACTERYFKEIKHSNNYDFYFNQIMMTLLYAWFYYEAEVFKFGFDECADNRNILANYVGKITSELNIGIESIIEYIYSDFTKYNLIRNDIPNTSGIFIEYESFADFIRRLPI